MTAYEESVYFYDKKEALVSDWIPVTNFAQNKK